MKKELFFMIGSIALVIFGIIVKDAILHNNRIATGMEEQQRLSDYDNEYLYEVVPDEEQQNLSGYDDEFHFEIDTEEKQKLEQEPEPVRMSNPRVFFEDITMVTDPESYLVLVNKNNMLRSDFSPTDMVLPNVLTFQHQHNPNLFLRTRAATRLEEMFQTAFDEAGLILLARSGYRSFQTQRTVHERFVREHGQEVADWFSARPGHSEHQTGLAIDITADSVGRALVIGFGQTPEGQWLNQNAHSFGFILRYPQGREMDTGYQYEPWHFRYVGIESATQIFQQELILEEYLGRW